MRNFVLGAAFAATALIVSPARAFADETAPAAPPAAPAAAPPAEEAAKQGVAFEAHDLPFADALAKAKASSKAVFMDFTTDWCGWCRRLEADVFSREDVAKAMEAFVCLTVNAERGEGIELAKRYGARGFPTLVIVDAAGQEVDRIVGYRAPEPFLAEIERIGKGEGTLPALKAKLDAEPTNSALALAYAEKLAPSQPAEADRLLADVGERAKGTDRALEAKVLGLRAQVAEESGDREKAAALCERILDEFADTEAAAGALRNAVNAKIGPKRDFAAGLALIEKVRGKSKDGKLPMDVEVLSAAIHAAAAGQALGRAATAAGDDADKLNEIAWTAFEMRANLRGAIGWARKAVELSGGQPMILDTLANLLAVTGNLDEAIELEEKAAAAAGVEPAMRKAFEANVAKWKAERAALAEPASEATPPQTK